MILYGPPGTGKTTLARLVAATATRRSRSFSAVEAGRAEVRKVLERAAHRRKSTRRADDLLPRRDPPLQQGPAGHAAAGRRGGPRDAHRGDDREPVLRGQRRAAVAQRRSTSSRRWARPTSSCCCAARSIATSCTARRADDEALAFLADRAGGDARTALAALELAAATVPDGRVTLAAAEDALQRHAVRYDKDGDQHYDPISAWIKAVPRVGPRRRPVLPRGHARGRRGPALHRAADDRSSPPRTSATPTRRRSSIATAAAAAVEHVGLPECEFALSQATIYLALAPKSKEAAKAIWAAREHVREHGAAAPPPWLRSSGYAGAAKLGRGLGYDDPHAHPGHLSEPERHARGAAGRALLAARRAGGGAARPPRGRSAPSAA